MVNTAKEERKKPGVDHSSLSTWRSFLSDFHMLLARIRVRADPHPSIRVRVMLGAEEVIFFSRTKGPVSA